LKDSCIGAGLKGNIRIGIFIVSSTTEKTSVSTKVRLIN